MSWLSRYRELTRRGILGMNRRNAECILDHNPRHRFPLVDGKKNLADLCQTLGADAEITGARDAFGVATIARDRARTRLRGEA